ncbi:XRE family transcriptional regulator [Sphingobium quisquiliarum P25]|uniref:XRE family transcriptional regulator n=1 Tax=Sphingobium quisquiliarum P25 TaxID=1329909 RepID=T0IJL5_9SPHN|nr:short-chain fatty acyl-CoA regulator family protein [Sphingobium quisquiliarum]EQB09819.1 XRE family transcriptional regulator [Sphingobium quisquiliarum P25]
MAKDRPVYMGPRLRRLRRELGLTQADMAADLEISPSYVALLERNQRPLTADMLLRLARTYRMDMSELAGDGGAEQTARLQAALKEPMFADIDLPALAMQDVAVNYPGFAEALLRLHTAYREEQLTLADRGGVASGDAAAPDPVAEARRFIAARRNSFPLLDDAGERLAAEVAQAGGMPQWLKTRHGLRVRRLPSEVMAGSMRRLDRHRDAVLIDDTLDEASGNFQLAQQVAYLEMRGEIDALLKEGQFVSDGGRRLTRRALASYGAAAILMPYAAFAKAVEARRYDVEALARQFGASFEQVAHRLTSLQKPGQERVPFFFLRVDPAGNISKLLDGAGFPFARHGGSCPLWSVHQLFGRPREVVTQWLELPDGQRFFSIARTVSAGGGGWGMPRVERAVALLCAAEHAHRLIYAQGLPPSEPTPVGVTCRLCHRSRCLARSAPPIGRDLLPEDFRRGHAPFGFSDG